MAYGMAYAIAAAMAGFVRYFAIAARDQGRSMFDERRVERGPKSTRPGAAPAGRTQRHLRPEAETIW